MIWRTQMNRWLSGVLCPLALGLGLFLSPAVLAQAPKIADPFLQAQPAPKESVDQQIEILKKAIMILEQQKSADKTKAAPKQPNEGDVRKAKEDLAAIAKELEVKRSEVRALEQKHAIAMKRLAELTGGNAAVRDHIQWMLATTPGDPAGAKVLRDWIIQNPELRDARGSKILLQDMIRKQAPDAVRKPESLEQKLDRLMKEIEELRREIRQQKGSKPQGAAAPTTAPANLTAPATTEKATIITVPVTTERPTSIIVPTTTEKPTIINLPVEVKTPKSVTIPATTEKPASSTPAKK